LFDHSQGHSKKHIGSLQASCVNLNFGGNQPVMRDTEITEGCLGPFPRTLDIGDIQRMTFTSADDGPFYLKQQEREQRRHNRETGKVIFGKQKTKKQLIDELKNCHNIVVASGKPSRLKDVQELARQHGLLLSQDKRIIQEGWEGKPKGILQILYERGLIAVSTYKSMKLDGRKDPETGDIVKGTLLHALLEKCDDFKHELSMLQILGQEIGVAVDATPKYHAELAGEGIEYSWGYSKSVYRHSPLSSKKGRPKKFEQVGQKNGKKGKIIHLHLPLSGNTE